MLVSVLFQGTGILVLARAWGLKKTKKKLTVATRSFEKLGMETVTESEWAVKELGTFMNI